LVHSLLSVPAPPQGTQWPVLLHVSVAPKQSLVASHVQPVAWQLCPGAHGVQFGVPGGHAIELVAHVHSPPTHISPAAHVVPQPPQCAALLSPSMQFPPQHNSPSAEHALPAVLAAPHATHWPPTHTWSSPGQPAEVTHVQMPALQACPAPQAEHAPDPGAHAFSWLPQVHSPAMHNSPQPQIVPQPPQWSSSVCGSVQPDPQHVSPPPHASPFVPAAPHALHALVAHTLVAGEGQSPGALHAQVPVAHERSPGHGEQPAVPGAQASVRPAHVHSPATQVDPATQVVLQPPQLRSSASRSTHPSVQHAPPPEQISPGTWPAHSVHEPLKQMSSGPAQSPVVKQVHDPPAQFSPGAHALQSNVPGVHRMAAAPHEHSPSTQFCANAHIVPHPPQLDSCVSSSTHAPAQHRSPPSQRSPSLPGMPHGVHRPATQVSVGDGQSEALLHPQPPARQPSDFAHGVHSSVPAGHAICSAPQVHLPSEQVSPTAHVVPQPPQLATSLSASTHWCPQHAPPASPQSAAARHATHTPASSAHTPASGGHAIESEHGIPPSVLVTGVPPSMPASNRGRPESLGVVASAAPTGVLPPPSPPSGSLSPPRPPSPPRGPVGANVPPPSSCFAHPANALADSANAITIAKKGPIGPCRPSASSPMPSGHVTTLARVVSFLSPRYRRSAQLGAHPVEFACDGGVDVGRPCLGWQDVPRVGFDFQVRGDRRLAVQRQDAREEVSRAREGAEPLVEDRNVKMHAPLG
jgi:hypothetical protein